MRVFFVLSIATAFVCATLLQPLAASPWGRADGETFSASRIEGYNARDELTEFDQLTVQSYVERGMGEHWLLGGTFATATQRIDNARGRDDLRTGLSQAELFVQRQLVRGNGNAVAGTLMAVLPTGTRSLTGTDRRAGADGAVEANVQGGISAGRSFFAGKSGYRYSIGDDADQLRLESSAGRHMTDRLLFLLEGQAILAVGDARTDGADFSLASVSPSGVVRITPRTFFQLGGRVDLWGRNLTPGRSVFAAIWFVR